MGASATLMPQASWPAGSARPSACAATGAGPGAESRITSRSEAKDPHDSLLAPENIIQPGAANTGESC